MDNRPALAVEPEGPAPARSGSFARVDQWLDRRILLVAGTLTGIGLLLRLLSALPGFLNPDEVFHLLIAGDTSLADAIRRSLAAGSPHPQLFNLLLYLLNVAGASDVVFRLPSVLAGSAALWFFFRWLQRILGNATALTGLIILTFMPELIRLSGQVREYALLLMLAAAALLLLERGLAEWSAGRLLASAGTMMLAVSTHYAAIWIAPALAAYALVRFARRRLPARVVVAWAAGQVGFVLLTLYYYATQIARLTGSERLEASEGWLRESYFHAGQDNLLLFPLRQTIWVFQYLFSSDIGGIAALVLGAAGAVLLVIRAGSNRDNRTLVLILILPFALTALAGLLGLYPYGGTRHSVYLGLFAAASIATLAGRLLRHRLWPALAAAVVLVPLWHLGYQPPAQYIAPQDQRRELLASALDDLRRIAPDSSIILADNQTSILLRWYLCGHRRFRPDRYEGSFVLTPCERYRLVTPNSAIIPWSLGGGRFGEMYRRLVRLHQLEPGDDVYVVDAGWQLNLFQDLWVRYNLVYPGPGPYGRAISLFRVPVGAEPGNPAVAAGLSQLVQETTALTRLPVRALLWPTDQFSDSTAALTAPLAGQPCPYVLLDRAISSGQAELADFLPALAFWAVGSHELVPEALRLMDRGVPYRVGDVRFTLLGQSEAGPVVAYLIEPSPD